MSRMTCCSIIPAGCSTSARCRACAAACARSRIAVRGSDVPRHRTHRGCRTTSQLRFEVDGANAARDFLLQRGLDEAAARKVWLGIALHTTPGVPEFLDPEIALVTAGVETDVLGIGRDDLTPEELSAVTEVHPRPDFKNRILRAFTDGVRQRPGTTFGTVNADVLAHFDDSFVREDFVEIILKNGWPE